MILARFTLADAASCYDVFYTAVHTGAAPHYTAAQRQAWAPHAAMPASFPEKLAAQVCWVARCEGKSVGFFSMEADGHLDTAFVAPDFRRTGLASDLYDKIILDARSLELGRLFTEASHLARPFFEKRGWSVTMPETVTRNGVHIERFQMAIDLP